MIPDEEVVREKLTKWENEPTLTKLKENLQDSTQDHDTHITNVNRWLDNRNITGKAVVKTNDTQSSVVPRLIRKQAEWRYAPLSDPFFSTEDIFNAGPVSAGDKPRVEQNATVLNYQFNSQLNKVDFIGDTVRDAVDIGGAFIKVGWITEEEKVTKKVPQYEFVLDQTGFLGKQYMMLLQMKQTDIESYMNISTTGLDQALEIFMRDQVAYKAIQIGEEEVTETEETKNQPELEVYDHENLYIDPSCSGKIERAQFVIEAFKSSVSDLKKVGYYENLDAIDRSGNTPENNPDFNNEDENTNFTFKDKAREQFVVYTYWGNWDIYGDDTTQPIVASWVGDVLIRMEMNPYPDRTHPFVAISYMPKRKSVHGEPDGELIEDNQKIIGSSTRAAIDIVSATANGQTGTKVGFLDSINEKKFLRGDPYKFQGENPQQSIYQHKSEELPRSLFDMIAMNTNDAESLTGVKAYSSGLSGKGLGDVAAGVRGVLDAASKRELDILRRIAEGVLKVGRKIIAMNADFLSEEEVVRITNKPYIQPKRDDLAGNCDIILSISTAEEDNKKAEELAFMLQTLGPNQDPNVTKMIQSEIAKLRKMPELAKRIEEYQPQPDPMQVMKAQLELNLLRAQIAKEETLAIKHAATAELDGIKGLREVTQAKLNAAKEGTEVAKAKFLSSDADRKNLDFVEQEAGVNHERDMQQIQQKHTNDASMEMLKQFFVKKQEKTTKE